MNISNRITPEFLARAGIGPGMRLLDLGCAFGDLTRLVARMVGPDGAVVGVDRNADYLARARAMTAEAGAAPIRYESVDLTDVAALKALADPPFDAIVVRRVLMYLPDPEALLAVLPGLVKQSGMLAIQEHDATGMPIAAADLPLHRQVHGWIWRTVAAESGRAGLGLALPAMLARAGWTVESWRAEAVTIAADAPDHLAQGMRGMEPRAIAAGVVAAGEVDFDTLGARLEAERRGADAALLWDMMHLVVARVAA